MKYLYGHTLKYAFRSFRLSIVTTLKKLLRCRDPADISSKVYLHYDVFVRYEVLINNRGILQRSKWNSDETMQKWGI